MGGGGGEALSTISVNSYGLKTKYKRKLFEGYMIHVIIEKAFHVIYTMRYGGGRERKGRMGILKNDFIYKIYDSKNIIEHSCNTT